MGNEIIEGETILRVQEHDGTRLYCVYDNPRRSWLSRLPFIGILFGYEQFGIIEPTTPDEFEQEMLGKLGTRFKLIVKLEKIK